MTGEIAARFGLGYAPEGWQNLEAVFPDYQAKSLSEAGLVIVSEEGRRYDRFRDRIMFPIHNQRGVIIGFGGRVHRPGRAEVPELAGNAAVREGPRALRPVPGARRHPRRRKA